MGIACYAVFDPLKQLQGEDELNGSLLKVWALQQKRYVELSSSYWLESVELGLTLWEGTFEGRQDLWLRWCDSDGNVILTGAERANQAEERVEQAEERAGEAEQKAQRLGERLRAMGVNPDEI